MRTQLTGLNLIWKEQDLSGGMSITSGVTEKILSAPGNKRMKMSYQHMDRMLEITLSEKTKK